MKNPLHFFLAVGMLAMLAPSLMPFSIAGWRSAEARQALAAPSQLE
jgi:hypothetical protein